MHKKIVIIGAGFGGIACARSLSKNPNFEITIIDKNPYHVIHGNLYELASIPSDLVVQQEMYRSVNVPIKLIFRDNNIKFIQGEVVNIDPNKHIVSMLGKSIGYDYLVCSLGAEPNFFVIPGAEINTLPLQSADDALLLRSRIESIILFKKNQINNREINIVIAGGGIAGVELAAELRLMANFLSWENNFPSQKINISIVEMSDNILPGFNKRVVELTANRLKKLGIDLLTSTKIIEYTKDFIKTEAGEVSYDVAVWTAGVKAKKLPLENITVSKGDRVTVDQYFRSVNYQNIFVLGDQSCFLSPDTNSPLPGTAAQATRQGRYVAEVINDLYKNQKPKNYSCKCLPFCFPVGGNWAIYSSSNMTLSGWFGYAIRELIWLKYFISILGVIKGIHYKLRTHSLYNRIVK